IIESLDIDALVRLRYTSTVADAYVSYVLRERFHAIFRPSMSSLKEFCKMFESTQAVVSGAPALAAMFPDVQVPRLPSPIDIYVPRGGLEKLLDHLISVQGFGPTIPSTNRLSSDGDMAYLRDSLPPSYVRKGAQLVRIIESMTHSSLLPIPSQWNTALHNYISARRFVCAYTHLTATQRALLTPSDEGETVWTPESTCASALWTQAGWSVAVDWPSWAPSGSCDGVSSLGCAAAVRHFGDRHSSVASFHLSDDPQEPQRSRDELETVVWWRGGPTCSPACHSGEILIFPGARPCLFDLLRT
ncbi:hypothetical protein C8Q76DRAFT_566920, partial [Earliella scabrosa]